MISRAIGLLLFSTAALAQTPSPVPTSAAKVYFDFQVEKTVVPSSKNKAPEYPKSLRSANIEGQVDAEFAVDSTGRVIPGSFKVLKSTQDLFSKAVADVLPSLRFTPASIGGKKVAQLVHMPFVFSLAADTGAVARPR